MPPPQQDCFLVNKGTATTTRVLLRGRVFFKDSGHLSLREECEPQIDWDNNCWKQVVCQEQNWLCFFSHAFFHFTPFSSVPLLRSSFAAQRSTCTCTHIIEWRCHRCPIDVTDEWHQCPVAVLSSERTEQKKAFRLWEEVKEERDETCFLLGACIVTFSMGLYSAFTTSLFHSIFFYSSPQFWSSCPSWWCHILWSLPAWRRPPFPWRWARWTDWARWPAWPTWRNFMPTPMPGLPPPSLRWTPRLISQWSSESMWHMGTVN